MGADIDILVAGLGHADLLRLADYHRDISDKLRAAAQRKAAALSRDSRNRARLDQLETIPDLFRQYIAGGMTHDAAVYATSVCTGSPLETVHAWLQREQKERDAAALVKRDHDIADALCAGRSTREVAAAFGLSQTRVRQIARSLRTARELLNRAETAKAQRANGEFPKAVEISGRKRQQLTGLDTSGDPHRVDRDGLRYEINRQ